MIDCQKSSIMINIAFYKELEFLFRNKFISYSTDIHNLYMRIFR